MPLSLVKILSDDDTDDLTTKLATYKGAAGAELLDTQRAMAVGHLEEVDGDARTIMALAHGGLDTPATGAKTADLQHLAVRARGTEAEMQAAVDEALSDVVHQEEADFVTSVAGTITSTLTVFAAEDVGRKVRIGAATPFEVRTITAFTDASNVDYDDAAEGALTSGTGLTGALLGAEVVQDVAMQAMKKDAKNEIMILMACEGEAY